jgi:hypothetical protein
MLLAIAITIGGIMLIIGIVNSAPNFLVAMLILLPLVPLLRLVGDIANPDVDVPLQPRILLRDYLLGGFFLLIMFGVILLTAPVVGVGLAMFGAALAVLVGVVGVLLADVGLPTLLYRVALTPPGGRFSIAAGAP